MKKLPNILSLVLLTGCLLSCSTSFKSKDTEMKYEEYVFAVQLVEDSAMIKEYLDYHQNIWPEVEAGFKKAGYKEIRLYRFESFVTMILKVPAGSDLDQMGQMSNDSHPKAAQWNKLMDGFQKGLPGTREGQSWVAMEKYYEFKR